MPTYRLQPKSEITLRYTGEPFDFEADDEEHASDIIEEYMLEYGEMFSWDVKFDEVDEH